MKNFDELYVEMQNMAGFAEGQVVNIVGKADDNQFGWCGVWTYEMDVVAENGEIGVIASIDGNDGILIDFEDGADHWFPFFCVKPSDEKIVMVKLNGEYTAKVTEYGITVGCQEMELSVIDALTKAKRTVLKK